MYDQWVLDTFDVDPSKYELAPPPPGGSCSAVSPFQAVAHQVSAEDVAQRQVVAAKITRLGREATPEDAIAVANHVAQVIPLHDLKTLQDAGVTYAVTRGGVATELPQLARDEPRGHTEGDTWRTTPGTYWEPKRQIIIATQDGPNSSRVVPGHSTSTSVDVLAHETGHALNRLRGLTSQSDTDEFKAAYAAPMTGHLADPYYHQHNASAGRDEANAESYAMALVSPTELRADSPTLYAYWQKHLGQ